jgi:hypothetical protein
VAVYGPPWVEVTDPRDILLADPPAPNNCASHLALAAVSHATGTLIRANDRREVEQYARIVAAKGDGTAHIYQGAVRTSSGHWLWPIATEVVEVCKADEPLTREGFGVLVRRLFRNTSETASVAERRALGRVIRELRNKPWPDLNQEEIEAVVGAAGRAISGIGGGAAFRREMASHLDDLVERTVVASMTGVAPNIAGMLTADQSAMAARIARDPLVFMAGRYGRVGSRFERLAQREIARGVRVGLSEREIGRRLAANANMAIGVGRSASYYGIVANAAIGRARSFGQMVGYQEAGFEMYRWEAVMDQRTCEVCRFLDGQEFPVSSGLGRFSAARRQRDPERAVRENFNWYRLVGSTESDDGYRSGGVIHVGPPQRGAEVGPAVATVRESAVGQVDRPGTFRRHRGALGAGGTISPPAHGNCRCTTVPV